MSEAGGNEAKGNALIIRSGVPVRSSRRNPATTAASPGRFISTEQMPAGTGSRTKIVIAKTTDRR
jgi:hypothetical protein